VQTEVIRFYSKAKGFKWKNIRQLKRWLEEVCRVHNAKAGALTFVALSEEEIHEMNRSWLEHDYPTDVITFPHTSKDSISGDIYICPAVIEENAAEWETTYESEILRCTVHGLLHLLGHNDQTKAQQNAMRKTENESLATYEQLFHVKHEDGKV
jgi:probable rRNA maturation factor